MLAAKLVLVHFDDVKLAEIDFVAFKIKLDKIKLVKLKLVKLKLVKSNLLNQTS